MFHGVFTFMQLLTLVLILLIPLCSMGQKTQLKEWNSSRIDTLEIITDEVYSINIKVHEERKIRLKAEIEGELFEETLVNARIDGQSLRISTDLSPYFVPENDKLAAHKVMSVELELLVGADIVVIVRSKLASVTAEGAFDHFEVNLDQGYCRLVDFSGSAILYTIQGDIDISCKDLYQTFLSSKYGSVRNEIGSYGSNTLEAESIYGTITVRKSQ